MIYEQFEEIQKFYLDLVSSFLTIGYNATAQFKEVKTDSPKVYCVINSGNVRVTFNYNRILTNNYLFNIVYTKNNYTWQKYNKRFDKEFIPINFSMSVDKAFNIINNIILDMENEIKKKAHKAKISYMKEYLNDVDLINLESLLNDLEPELSITSNHKDDNKHIWAIVAVKNGILRKNNTILTIYKTTNGEFELNIYGKIQITSTYKVVTEKIEDYFKQERTKNEKENVKELSN